MKTIRPFGASRSELGESRERTGPIGGSFNSWRNKMKRCLAAIFIAILCSPWGWTQTVDVAAALGYPQMIVYNGKIVTMDDDSFGPQVGTIVQAMAIRDGKILLTGSNAEILPLAGPHTTKIDLKGREVLPAFTHSHEHPTDWAWTEPSPLEHVLPSGSNDFLIVRWLKGSAQDQLAQWKNVLKEEAAQAKPGQWVWLSFDYGSNFENADELVKAFPKEVTREALDELVPNNPARVRDAWPIGNQVMLNTKGYEEAKKVGAWSQGNGTGEEGAGGLGIDMGRSLEPDVMLKNHVDFLAELLKAEFELWASQGIVGFGSSPYASNNFRALSLLDQKAELPARFGWGYTGSAWDDETLRYVAGLLGEGTEHLWNVGAWDAPGGTCTTFNAPPGSEEQGTMQFCSGQRRKGTCRGHCQKRRPNCDHA
jgi:predicted amidohydrolase YtcJ